MTTVDPNLQAMWDALGILGFDLDGNPTPAASLVGGEQAFRERFIAHIHEARRDHDAAIEEVCDDPAQHVINEAAELLGQASRISEERRRMMRHFGKTRGRVEQGHLDCDAFLQGVAIGLTEKANGILRGGSNG